MMVGGFPRPKKKAKTDFKKIAATRVSMEVGN